MIGSMLGNWLSSRGNHLSPIYHGENGVRTLKELARSYLTITKDLTRVIESRRCTELGHALCRTSRVTIAFAIVRNGCAKIVDSAGRSRIAEWLDRNWCLGSRRERGVPRSAAESRKPAVKVLDQIPFSGSDSSL